MNNDCLKNAIEEILSSELIEMSQIPDIALYMDQITTFFEDKLNSNKRNDDDKILTKTMINNYTKAELIEPPIKKKYSKKHILSLIIIYNLKSILSINDISKVLKNSKDETELLYSNFLNIQNNEKTNFENDIFKQITEISANCENDNLAVCSIILMLINQANMRKHLAEKLIDLYLSESEEDAKTKES